MAVKRYKKKPVFVEAVQWTGDNCSEVIEFANHAVAITETILLVPTLGGWLVAYPGDYIIKGVKDEVYPCKPDVFEESYDLVIEEGSL